MELKGNESKWNKPDTVCNNFKNTASFYMSKVFFEDLDSYNGHLDLSIL